MTAKMPGRTAAEIVADMASTRARALRDLADLQTWPRHFERRALEMTAMARVYDFVQPEDVLELGCGNGFASALIGTGRRRVVATDLYRSDVHTHSIDLRNARRLFDGLGLTRCAVAAASASALPFADQTFDLVFSLFVLEHVPDRVNCLAEIQRVLRPGGLTVHAVPGAMWAVPAPLRFPVYLFRRAKARWLPRRNGSPSAETGVGEPQADAGGPMNWETFRRRYPAFPLPPPHGEYASYVEELLAYRRRSWMSLFQRHAFEVVACEPLTVLSPDLLLRLPDAASARLQALDRWLAGSRPLRGLGQFFVIVARPR